MKKKELEMLLQDVPSYQKPLPNLEQYVTPADIAADVVFIAHQFGDIKNKVVIDLGCGTGIFAVAAAITGAEKVIGIDIEKKCVKNASKYAQRKDLSIQFLVKDIGDVDIKADTILMNPPFGAQKSNYQADRTFIEKACDSGKVIYSLHLTETLSFLRKLVISLGGKITYVKKYAFPIKRSFDFHTKRRKDFEVSLLRIVASPEK